MRDLAIARATLRELAPLLFGALAIGLLIALASLSDVRDHVSESPNTWPLCVLPIAGLFGGLGLTGSRATLVHALVRPVARTRLVGWRLGILFVGLVLVGLPLWWLGRHQFANSPSLASIAIVGVLAIAFGAQGSTLSEREPNALAATSMLATALLFPVQTMIEADRLSWARVYEALGAFVVVPIAAATALLVVPVFHAWHDALPLRSPRQGARTVLMSLVASLAVTFGLVRPTLSWVGQPERGELLMVVAMSGDGLLVATGTRGRDGDRDVVDGLVVIGNDGERRTLWDRRREEPDATVWTMTVPELSIASPFDDLVVLGVVDGPEHDAEHPLRAVEVHTEIVGYGADPTLLKAVTDPEDPCCDAVYGELDGPLLAVRGNVLKTRAPGQPVWRSVQTLRATEVRGQRMSGYAVADGRVWAVNERGVLWSARLPWEEGS